VLKGGTVRLRHDRAFNKLSTSISTYLHAIKELFRGDVVTNINAYRLIEESECERMVVRVGVE
jgi:hypothetical protein